MGYLYRDIFLKMKKFTQSHHQRAQIMHNAILIYIKDTTKFDNGHTS